MNEILLLAGIVIIICILVHRLTFRLGVPSLLAFLALGMCFGVDGILHISFNNYRISEVICSISLIFIMFYGRLRHQLSGSPFRCRQIHTAFHPRRTVYRRTGGCLCPLHPTSSLGRKHAHRLCHLIHRRRFRIQYSPFQKAESKRPHSFHAGNGVRFQ